MYLDTPDMIKLKKEFYAVLDRAYSDAEAIYEMFGVKEQYDPKAFNELQHIIRDNYDSSVESMEQSLLTSRLYYLEGMISDFELNIIEDGAKRDLLKGLYW